ncbi:hypothetical protein [Mycobacterium sp. URHB0021]
MTQIDVYYGPGHEFAEWIDKHHLHDEPVLVYRHGSTTRGKIPDGWVLVHDDDIWITGAWELDGVDKAVTSAKQHISQL